MTGRPCVRQLVRRLKQRREKALSLGKIENLREAELLWMEINRIQREIFQACPNHREVLREVRYVIRQTRGKVPEGWGKNDPYEGFARAKELGRQLRAVRLAGKQASSSRFDTRQRNGQKV